MRSLTSAIIATGTLLAPTPGLAQSYDPSYPVCMHVYGELEGERMDCIFTSLDQCAASALGRGATCLINPYYAHAQKFRPTRASTNRGCGNSCSASRHNRDTRAR